MDLKTFAKVAAGATVVTGIMAATSARAQFDLASNGLGYFTPTPNPSEVNLNTVSDMISAYDSLSTGQSEVLAPSYDQLGGGSGNLTYTVDKGSSTPASLASFSPANLGTQILGTGNNSEGLSIPKGTTFIVAQWDGPNGADAVYYVGNLTQTGSASITLVNDVPGRSQYGLSHYQLVTSTPVPEPTTILAGAMLLLPFGASTLRVLRKRTASV